MRNISNRSLHGLNLLSEWNPCTVYIKMKDAQNRFYCKDLYYVVVLANTAYLIAYAQIPYFYFEITFTITFT